MAEGVTGISTASGPACSPSRDSTSSGKLQLSCSPDSTYAILADKTVYNHLTEQEVKLSSIYNN